MDDMKWIPVSRKLPPDGAWCLVSTQLAHNGGLERRDGVVITRFYVNGFNKECWAPLATNEIVTHWMPIPELPK